MPTTLPTTLHVLLIDDDEDDVLMNVHELRRAGYEPQWERVDTPDALLEAIRRRNWDLITCDWVMPQFSGPEALALLRQRDIDTPIIVVSGQVGEEYSVTAMRAGAQDFVSKHHLARLSAAVERELREVEVRRERKRAEDRVRFQADLLNAVGQVVVATDLVGRVTYWNRAAEELYGWPASEALGQNVLSLVPARSASDAAEIMSHVSRGESWSGEFMVQRRDGHQIRSMVTNSPVCDAHGEVIGVIGVSTDVSERERVAESLRALSAQQASILDAMPAHVAVLDRDGVIVSVNRAWREFAAANGLASGGDGANYVEVCESACGPNADEAGEVARAIRSVLAGQLSGFEIEYPCHSPEEKRWFRVLVAPVHPGEPGGAVIVHINITERVEAELKQVSAC